MNICPVEIEFDLVETTGEEFLTALHRLRKALAACDRCKAVDSCTFQEQFNRTVDSVVAALNEEWGMTRGT